MYIHIYVYIYCQSHLSVFSPSKDAKYSKMKKNKPHMFKKACVLQPKNWQQNNSPKISRNFSPHCNDNTSKLIFNMGVLTPMKRPDWTPIGTRWWFLIFLFSPDPWGDDPIWRAYFSKGLKPPSSIGICDYILLRKPDWTLTEMNFLETSLNINLPCSNNAKHV